MRQPNPRVPRRDPLAELAQALEEGDHGVVEAPVLEQARHGKVARAVPFVVVGAERRGCGGGGGAKRELLSERVGEGGSETRREGSEHAQLEHLHHLSPLSELLDAREAPTRHEPVPGKRRAAKLARDRVQEQERVAPRRVDLGPLDLPAADGGRAQG